MTVSMRVMSVLLIVVGLFAGVPGFTANVLATELPEDIADDDPFDDFFRPPTNPWYVGVRGGTSFADDSEFTSGGAALVSEYADPGYFFSIHGGRQLAGLGFLGVRAEIELGYLESEVESERGIGVNAVGGAALGDTSALVGLASLYYDFMPTVTLQPFVGAGIGFGHVNYDNHGRAATGVLLSDSDTGFAWHITAGLSHRLTEQTSLEFGYRYLNIIGLDMVARDGTASDGELSAHLLFAGLRYQF